MESGYWFFILSYCLIIGVWLLIAFDYTFDFYRNKLHPGSFLKVNGLYDKIGYKLINYGTAMTESYTAKFTIGQVIHHKKFDYRGVILDVDPVFNGTEEWYEKVAVSKPPKDKPWYHVLVEGSDQQRYVAERHLEPDNTGQPINHPMVDRFFSGFDNGVYYSKETMN